MDSKAALAALTGIGEGVQQRGTGQGPGGTHHFPKWRHELTHEPTPLDLEAARQEGGLDETRLQQQKDLVQRLKGYPRDRQ